MCSEDSVLQRLRCHPPDGQQALPSLPVVVGLVDVSGHTKVWEEKTIFISCSQAHTDVIYLKLFQLLFFRVTVCLVCF